MLKPHFTGDSLSICQDWGSRHPRLKVLIRVPRAFWFTALPSPNCATTHRAWCSEPEEYSRTRLGERPCFFPGETLVESWAGWCWLASSVPYLLKESGPIVLYLFSETERDLSPSSFAWHCPGFSTESPSSQETPKSWASNMTLCMCVCVYFCEIFMSTSMIHMYQKESYQKTRLW